ncbi:MAG: tetratricopeptide repeat protein [Chloroflexi bacterium]|nr:tetratricopeptide repeat protein [Chloroflexota bacterium]
MLKLQLLGGLQITLDDEPVTGFVSGKVQALLCYLALTPQQTHLRSSLAALFWGDMPDEDASTNLRQAIANLKRLLEPYFDITRQSVAFKAEAPHWIDAVEFMRTRDAGLYRGELLAGFGIADAPEFDDWLTSERERLHDQAISILRQQAASQQSAGSDETAIATMHRLLRLDPFQEESHRQLMMLLASSGQRPAALAQYERCREILDRELGVEPEIETARLYERIRTAQRLTYLPTETTPFIGRTAELDELSRRLNDPTCHLVTIVGLGGMGKTRLALRLGHAQAGRMLHGAVMIQLTSIRTLDSFLTALADALRLQLTLVGTPRGQILDYLREKHLLLILDNVEQLTGIIDDFLAELISTASDLKLVMTSRQRFNLRGEWMLALEGLPCGDSREDGATPPAMTLFWTTAERVRGDDLLRRQPAEAVQRICALVHGMPLAIELAAAWSRLLTVAELADEIGANVTGLEADHPRNEERHRSLRAVFDHSWQLFSAQEQRVLMALALFPGGFTRESAQAVAGASLVMLLGIVDKMLVQRQDEGRFVVHEMLRQYLLEKLADSGLLGETQDLYFRYYTKLLQQRQARLKTHEQRALLDELTQETDNIHAAWELAVRADRPDILSDLLPGVSLFHDLKSNWRVALAVLEGAEAVFGRAGGETYAVWLSHLALATSRLDQAEKTTELTQRCLSLLSRDNPAHIDAIARALLALGYSEALRGAHNLAIPYAEEALALRETLGDEWDRAQCLMRLASGHAQRAQIEVHYGDSHREQMLEHLARALPYAERAIEISDRIGDEFLAARLQTLMANLLLMEGNLEGARELHLKTLPVYKSVGSLDGMCMVTNGMGNVAFMREQYPEAIEQYLEALAIARQIGARNWEANALNNLAVSSFHLHELRASRSYFAQSQAVFRALGHEQYVGMIQKDIDEIDELLASG